MDYVFKNDFPFPAIASEFEGDTLGATGTRLVMSGTLSLRAVIEDPVITIGDLSDDGTITLQNLTVPEEIGPMSFDIIEWVPNDGGAPTVTGFFSDYASLPRGTLGPHVRITGPDLPGPTAENEGEDLADVYDAEPAFLSYSDGEPVAGDPWGDGETLDLRDVEEWAFLGQSKVNLLPGTDAERQDRVETIALMFEAGLDRDGDIAEAGLNFWVDSVAKGLSLGRLAGAFLDTDEFQAAAEAFLADGTDLTDATVRDPEAFSNADYVRFLYGNVLDRAPGQDGFDFYLGRLEDLLAEPATAPTAREQMLIAFARSPENRDGSPFVEDLTETLPGIWEFA